MRTRRQRPKARPGSGRLKCVSQKVGGFDSKEAADADLPRLRERARADGRPLPVRSYECPFCGKWHHTSKPWSNHVLNEWLVPDRPPMLHTLHGSYYALAVAADLLGLSPGKLRRQAARGVISIYEDKYVPVEDVERSGTWQEQENLREATG
jgi:hypothetical protein